MVPVDTISTDINILNSVRPVKMLLSMLYPDSNELQARYKMHTPQGILSNINAHCTSHVTQSHRGPPEL